MKTISVRLDPNEISDAIEEIRGYQKEVERKTRLLVQKLVDLGAEIVRVKVVSMGAFYSGALLSGVGGYYSPALNAGFVRVTSDHAAFVEFGTGVVGQNSPHQNGEYLARASWDYASGPRIFTTKSGRVGWIYPTKDGHFVFTEGMKSRPFLYQSALELQAKFPQIVMEVFRA